MTTILLCLRGNILPDINMSVYLCFSLSYGLDKALNKFNMWTQIIFIFNNHFF